MTTKIKKMWSLMDKESKEEAVETIKQSFGLTSSAAIKQNWMYAGSIPASKEARTLLIMRDILKKQGKRLIQISEQ